MKKKKVPDGVQLNVKADMLALGRCIFLCWVQVCVNISLQDFGRKLTDQVVNPKRREVRFVSRLRIDASEASLAAPLLPSPLILLL